MRIKSVYRKAATTPSKRVKKSLAPMNKRYIPPMNEAIGKASPLGNYIDEHRQEGNVHDLIQKFQEECNHVFEVIASSPNKTVLLCRECTCVKAKR